MKDDKEKWIEDVFDSMKGSQRAKPSPSLYARIEGQLDAPEVKLVPRRQWSFAAAAAILVLVLNVFAMRQYTQNNEVESAALVVSDASGQSLISNYKIYE